MSSIACTIGGLVDKSRGRPADACDLFGVAHFGEHIRRLRLDRGLTQQELGNLANVTSTTIRRQEKSADCFWYPSTARAVLMSLEKIRPLSNADRQSYARGAKMAAFEQPDPTAPPPNTVTPDVNADLATAYLWVGRMLDEAGSGRTFAALEALAAAWNLDLPPRVRQGDRLPKIPALRHEIEVDGVQATVYTPVDPLNPQPPPASKPNRRTA